MDLEKLIHSVIDSLVDKPESLFIRIDDNGEHDVNIVIASEASDTAKLIGKHGAVANAIREVLSVAGKNEKKYYHIKFDSFDTEKED